MYDPQKRTALASTRYFLDHLKYCYKDNKTIFLRYLLYSLGRMMTYPFRKISEASDHSEERYQKFVKGKKEVVLDVLGNKMILPVADRGLARDIIIEGIREEASVKVLLKELKPDMNVVEAGANIGYYMLIESKILNKGKGKVYAIEPNLNSFEYLKKNAKLNNFKKVKFNNLALSDKPSVQKFYVSKYWNCSRFNKGDDDSDVIKVVNMKMETLDRLFAKSKERIDLIRMDVEGYEFNILRGATELMKKNPGMAIYMEFHAQFFNTKQREEIIKFMKDNKLAIKYLFGGEEMNPKPYSKTYKDIRNARFTTYYLYLVRQP